MRPVIALSIMLAVFSLSACSTGGLKSAFRNEPTPVAAAPVAVVAVDPNAPHEPTPMDTFRALAPPSGMKYTQLFAQPVDDNETRFRRLETSVQDLRNDFDTIVPSMVRLVAVEKDMKDLVGQLQTLNGTAAAAPVPTMAPAVPLATGQPPVDLAPQQAEAAPIAAPPAQEPVPQAAGVPAAGQVRAVRIGDHGDKTRVVFDVTSKPKKNAVIANDDKQLIVDLDGLGWTIQNSWTAKSGDLVSGYHYDGGKAVFDLMSKSKIKAQDVIAGEGGRGYRLVIDLVRVNPL